MVPRVDISAIAADIRSTRSCGYPGRAHSRYPVYRESLDDVIGMIHIKDVLAYWAPQEVQSADILRRVVFVAPTLPVLDMLLDMRRSAPTCAVVDDSAAPTACSPSRSGRGDRGEIEDEQRRRPDADGRRGRRTIDATAARPSNCWSRRSAASVRRRAARIDTVGGLIFPCSPHSERASRPPSVGCRVRSARRRSAAHPAPRVRRRPRLGRPPDRRTDTMTLQDGAPGRGFAGCGWPLAMPPLYWLPLGVLGIPPSSAVQTAPPQSALLRGWLGALPFRRRSYWIIEAFFVRRPITSCWVSHRAGWRRLAFSGFWRPASRGASSTLPTCGVSAPVLLALTWTAEWLRATSSRLSVESAGHSGLRHAFATGAALFGPMAKACCVCAGGPGRRLASLARWPRGIAGLAGEWAMLDCADDRECLVRIVQPNVPQSDKWRGEPLAPARTAGGTEPATRLDRLRPCYGPDAAPFHRAGSPALQVMPACRRGYLLTGAARSTKRPKTLWNSLR